jgi:hypothetical protein
MYGTPAECAATLYGASWMTPWSFTWNPSRADSVRIASIFPVTTVNDRSYFNTQLDYDVNMATVVRETASQVAEARRRGTILMMERYCGIVPR